MHISIRNVKTLQVEETLNVTKLTSHSLPLRRTTVRGTASERLFWPLNAISNLGYQGFFSQLDHEKSVLKNKPSAKGMWIEWLQTYLGRQREKRCNSHEGRGWKLRCSQLFPSEASAAGWDGFFFLCLACAVIAAANTYHTSLLWLLPDSCPAAAAFISNPRHQWAIDHSNIHQWSSAQSIPLVYF